MLEVTLLDGFHQVKEYLSSSDGLKEVLEEDTGAKQEMGIHGVPYFLIQSSSSEVQHRLSGAQSVAAFTSVFEKTIAATQ